MARLFAIFLYESLFTPDLEIYCSISRCMFYHTNKSIIKALFEHYHVEPLPNVFGLLSLLLISLGLAFLVCYLLDEQKPAKPLRKILHKSKIKLKSAQAA